MPRSLWRNFFIFINKPPRSEPRSAGCNRPALTNTPLVPPPKQKLFSDRIPSTPCCGGVTMLTIPLSQKRNGGEITNHTQISPIQIPALSRRWSIQWNFLSLGKEGALELLYLADAICSLFSLTFYASLPMYHVNNASNCRMRFICVLLLKVSLHYHRQTCARRFSHTLPCFRHTLKIVWYVCRSLAVKTSLNT